MQQWLNFLGGALITLGVIGAGWILWAIEPSRIPFVESFQRQIVITQVATAVAAFLGGAIPGLILLALAAIVGGLNQISLENQQLLRVLENKPNHTQAG